MSPALRVSNVEVGERAADQARQELGLGLDAPISVLDAVEDLAGVLVGVHSLPDDVAGLFYKRRGRTLLLVNGNHPVQRQRFTLAHEFGHSRMDHSPRLESPTLMLSKDPQEAQANYFAGAFLAPRQAVRSWAERHRELGPSLELVVRLSAFFGTSADASRIRLEITGVLTRADSERLKASIALNEHRGMVGALGMTGFADALSRLKRDVDTGTRGLPRLPAELIRRARRAHEQGLLDDEELAEMLRGAPIFLADEDELDR